MHRGLAAEKVPPELILSDRPFAFMGADIQYAFPHIVAFRQQVRSLTRLKFHDYYKS
jgi:hypothetical protein